MDEYPIRFHCVNCRALIKGTFIMKSTSLSNGLHLYNAEIEECDVDLCAEKIKNADYVIDISGELPCATVRLFDGNIIKTSPFLECVQHLDVIEQRRRLQMFANNMSEWKKWKSIAFQLLDEGSIEYIPMALKNKLGNYNYPCDNQIKTLQCLQEIVHEYTDTLFTDLPLDAMFQNLMNELQKIDKSQLHAFVDRLGGVQELIFDYRRLTNVFLSFMGVYPNILPAEEHIRYREKSKSEVGIATCSFGDIKGFYQDAYETVLSLASTMVCIDNILLRGTYMAFGDKYDLPFARKIYVKSKDDYARYEALDNGMKLKLFDATEPVQKFACMPENQHLRNGIGHNNVSYDGVHQKIIAYGFNKPYEIKYRGTLIDMAIDCIGLTKTAIVMSDVVLFMLRQELSADNIRSIIHPRFYKNVGPNDKCPCGSNRKYKKCCKTEVEAVLRDARL